MLSYVSNVTSIASNIISIYKESSGYIDKNAFTMMICYVLNLFDANKFGNILLLGIVICLLFNVIKLKRNKEINRQDVFSEDSHQVIVQQFYNLTHDYRNNVNLLVKLYKTKALTVESLTSIVKNELELMLGYLCEAMQVYTEAKVCACIKIVVSVRKNAVNFNNATLTTIARSKNSDPVRVEMDSNVYRIVKISDNTDFLDIVSGVATKGYFYQKDLIAYAQKLRSEGKVYKNSNAQWEKYYKGAIVVPLRISNDKIFYAQRKEGYSLIGFLCVDSMDNELFTEQREKLFTNILKSYGYLIFDILSKYKYYMEKV